MKQCLIIILLLLSACSPKNANLPVMSQQDAKSDTFREDLAKLREGLTTIYAASPKKGEVNINADKGNAYVKWDEQGMTIFLSRDFVPDPSQPLAEKLNEFLTQFHKSVYSNAEGKLFIPGTDVYFQFDVRGITLFVPKTEVDAHYDSGVAYYNKGQYDEAISDFTKALEINPKFAEAHYYRGIAYAKKGQYEEAISDYNKALEINPRYALAYYGRGLVYNEYKGQYDRAISDYSKALEINPRFNWAYVGRGIAYAKKGQDDEGISDFSKALEINPRDVWAYNNRGAAYNKKGQYDEAISDYNKALEINPRYALAYHNRGIAYNNKGQYDQAISDYTKALEINPGDASTYYNRGIAYGDMGQYDEAVSDYTKALEIDPGDAWTYYNRGIVYEKKGQYDQAISDYSKALEINPICVEAYNNLAWVLATANVTRFRNGEKALKLALKACELTDWKNPHCLDTLAAAYARLGDFANAIKWQEKALEPPKLLNSATAQQRLILYREHKAWPAD